MVANIFGTDWLWVLLVVVVLFGGSQLPKLAKNAGEAMKEFRKAHDEASQSPEAASSPGAASGFAQPATATVAPPALAPAQTATASPPVVQQAQAAAPGTEEKVTLSRAELDALLADREARARASAEAGGGPAQS